MKDFRIFKSSSGRVEAVKQGWSWPAFFFSTFWAFAKGLNVLGIILLGFATWLTVSEAFAAVNVSREAGQIVDYSNSILSLIILLALGYYGNELRERNLQIRGYEYRKTLRASGTKSAVSLYIADAAKDR